MKKRFVMSHSATPEYVAAIQRNVDAHRQWHRHPCHETFHGPDGQEQWGISTKSFRALELMQSLVTSFAVEHGLWGSSKRARRAEARPLREALKILESATSQVDKELAEKLQKHPSFNRSPDASTDTNTNDHDQVRRDLINDIAETNFEPVRAAICRANNLELTPTERQNLFNNFETLLSEFGRECHFVSIV